MKIDYDLYSIDLNRLEEECIEQPKQFLVWAEKLKKSQDKLRRLKISMEEVKAALSIKMVKDPKKFNLPAKPTATIIANKVLIHKRYKEAQEEYLLQKEHMDTLQIMVSAHDDRKKAIEGAIKLHGQEYFSKPWRPYTGSSKHKRVKKDRQ